MTQLTAVPSPWACHGCGRQDATALVVVEVQLGTKTRRARVCRTCRVPLAHAEVCLNDPRTCPRIAEHAVSAPSGTHRRLEAGGAGGNSREKRAKGGR